MIRRMQVHVCTAEDFLDLFPTEDAAGHALARLYKNGKVKRVGMLQGERGGRPRWMYCTRSIKSDWLFHEHQLTKVFLAYVTLFPNAQFQRFGVIDEKRLPDAKMTLRREYLVEMDCGTEAVDFIIRKRFSRYIAFDGLVLWICPDSARVEELRASAKKVADTALFAVINDVIADPFGEVWIDHYGNTTALR